MTYLELDSYIEPPEGYPEGPYFSSDLWPLIMKRRDEVSYVLWFRHDPPINPADGQESRLTNLGPLTQLSKQTIEMLEHRSFYGGHLNVLYVTQAQSPLLMELVKLYPRPGVIGSDPTKIILSVEAAAELAHFVESLPPDLAVLSFAHDADPAYIFGERTALEKLQAV